MAKSIINDQLLVEYVPDFYESSVGDQYYQELLENVSFETITFNFGEKEFTPSRKVAAFGDDGLVYAFSKITVSAKPWTSLMRKIKADVEQHMGIVFNFCLLNFYPDGNAKISAHQDKETSLDAQAPIACVSLGSTRQMLFTRSKDYTTPVLDLEHGSLMSMHPPTNRYWKHAIPSQPGVTAGRISLTFRTLSSVNPERRLSSVYPPAKRKRFTPVQEDPSNELLLEKEVGIGVLLKVYHTRLGLYVGLYPVNTGTRHDYRCTVFINPTTWMEFSNKLCDFDIHRKDSAFMCSDQLFVCAKHDNTCVIQSLYSTACGYRLNEICLELDEEELAELKNLLPEISEFLLQNLFSVSLPKLILECSVKPNNILPLSSTNENIFWECISQAISDIIHKSFKCDGCKINDLSQFNHDCMLLTAREKFNFIPRKALLAVNISKLSYAICKNVNVEQLSKNILNTLTMQKCIEIFEEDL